MNAIKNTARLLTLLILLWAPGCASAPPEGTPVLDLGDLSQAPGAMEGASGPDLIIRVPQGVEVPVSLKAKGDLFRFTAAEGGLTATRDVWVWLHEGGFWISEDLKTWTPIEEAFGGSLSIGAGVEDGHGFIDVGLDVKTR